MLLYMQNIAWFDLSNIWKSAHMWPLFFNKWQILKSQRISYILPPRCHHVFLAPQHDWSIWKSAAVLLVNLKFPAKSAEVSPHWRRWACVISKEKLSKLGYSFLRKCAEAMTFMLLSSVTCTKSTPLPEFCLFLHFHDFFTGLMKFFEEFVT